MQHRDHDRVRSFSRRALVLGGAQGLMLGGLVARMYWLQVVEGERYRLAAEDNRVKTRLLPPPRGRIVDRFGVPLAVNLQNYRVMLTAEDAPDVEETLARLAQLIPVGPEVLREARNKEKFVPVTVAEFLSWEQVARLRVNAPDLPGISIDIGIRRHYPFGAHAGHVVGYVGEVSEAELTGEQLLKLPGFRIGKNGVERSHDLALRGEAGHANLEVNSVGRVIRELEREEGRPGTELVTTLDMGLQDFASRRLGEESGAVVVLDARSGDVLALASMPAFDPNEFASGISGRSWRALSSNERAPLVNKAIAGQYAPGSTFKMVVALAALEAGAISESTAFFCNGKLRLGDGLFHCWKRHGHGTVSLLRGIRESCDVYFYEVARRTGVDRIADMAGRLGLGRRYGFEVPGEEPGLIPTRAWKRAELGQPWYSGETLIAGIGQGFVLTTPLQLAVMAARLASGRAVVPQVTRAAAGSGDAAPAEFAELAIDGTHLGLVRRGMDDVVNHERGTARRSHLRLAAEGQGDHAMAGKTGTAQVRRITAAERETEVLKNEDLPWRFRDHALFVAFAPIADPRYAVAVVIEHGGGGSRVAAPIARDVVEECLRRESGRAAPASAVAAAAPAAAGPGDAAPGSAAVVAAAAGAGG